MPPSFYWGVPLSRPPAARNIELGLTKLSLTELSLTELNVVRLGRAKLNLINCAAGAFLGPPRLGPTLALHVASPYTTQLELPLDRDDLGICI